MRSISIVLCALLVPIGSLAQASRPAVTCPYQAAPRVNDAARALLAGDAASAESLYGAQTTKDLGAFEGLVRSQLEQNKLEAALASANNAVRAFPKSADAQALVGDVLLRSGQIPEASDAYLKALALDRCSAQAHFGLGQLNDLAARHATGAREITLAHRLAPANPRITAAYLETLPPAQRFPVLRAFLAEHPALPSDQLLRLAGEVAVLDQHLTCTSEAFSTVSLPLLPIFQDGRRTRSWGLKARINDAALPLLEVDSTASGIMLNADDAAKAHVRPLLSASTNPDGTYAGVADVVQIGTLTLHGCPVTVVPNRALDNRNSLIGTDFFRDHIVHLDYVARTLALSPLPTPPDAIAGLTDQFIAAEEKGWSPIYTAGPSILLPTLINKKGPFLFALDTGVGASVLSPAVTATQLSRSKDVTLNLEGTSGSIVKVIPREGGGETDVADVHGPTGALLRVSRPVKLPVYRFTSNEMPDDSAVSFDISPMSHAHGIEIAGLLGFDILSYYSIDINYRDGLARILFDQNRRYHVQQFDLQK